MIRDLQISIVIRNLVATLSICTVLPISAIWACCDRVHFFDVVGVEAGDALNVRKYPNYKSEKIGAIPANTKGAVGIVESAAVLQFECLTKPIYDNALISKIESYEDLEGKPEYQTLAKSMSSAPIKQTKAPKGTWCKIRYEKKYGWVNARYLKFRCTVTVPDAKGYPDRCASP